MTSTRLALRGVIPPLCTPFGADFEVDAASLRRLVEHVLTGGADGVFVLGSTGEVAYLPDRQRRAAVQIVVDQVAGRVPVLVGVIDMATERVAVHIEAAVRDGADGVVVTAPFYTRTHPAEIERHFNLLAERSRVPVYAYDLPISVRVKLDTAMLLRLAESGALAGVKDSSGDDGALRQLLVLRRELGPRAAGFSVLTGSELTVDGALGMGADGVVPGYGNVDPAGYARLYRHCLVGDWKQARAEQERLLRGFEIVRAPDPGRMGGSSAALGAFKAALHLLGVIDNPATAPPQIALDEAEVARVRGRLVASGLEPCR